MSGYTHRREYWGERADKLIRDEVRLPSFRSPPLHPLLFFSTEHPLAGSDLIRQFFNACCAASTTLYQALRNGPGTMTLKIGNIPAGNYKLILYLNQYERYCGGCGKFVVDGADPV